MEEVKDGDDIQAQALNQTYNGIKYTFDEWEDQSTTNPRTYSPTGNATHTASFTGKPVSMMFFNFQFVGGTGDPIGLDWDEQTYGYLNQANDMYQARISNDSIRYLLKKPVIVKPGSKFNYNSMLSVMLTRIIAKSSGMLTNEFAELYLFNPLGIDNYSWDRLEDGLLDATGGLHMRPRDMAKIGYLFLNDGKWKGKSIISQEWLTESTKAHTTHDLEYGYGYQWRAYSLR